MEFQKTGKTIIAPEGEITVDLSGAWPAEYDGRFDLSGVRQDAF